MATDTTPRFLVCKISLAMLVCFNAGVNFGVFGPSLPDLKYLTSATTQEISTVFSALGISILVGGLCAGPLFDHVSGFLLLGILCLLQAGFICVLGYFHSLTAVLGLTVGIVLTNTGLFTGCQALGLKIWPKYSAPVIQAINLIHSVGLAVSPLALTPLLGDYRNTTSGNSTTDRRNTDHERAPFLKIEWGFIVISLFDVFVAVLCFIWVICEWRINLNTGKRLNTSGHGGSGRYRNPSTLYRIKSFCRARCSPARIVVVVSMAWFCILTGINFVLLVSYLYTFLNQYLGWSPDQATTLLSVFQFARFAFNVIVIPVSQCVHPRTLLIFDVSLMSAAALVMLFTISTGPAAVWVCLTLMAIASASIVGTLNSLVASSLPYGPGTLVGLTYSFAGLGQIIFPPVVAHLLEKYGSYSFPAMLLGSHVLAAIPLTSWLGAASIIKKTDNRHEDRSVHVDTTDKDMTDEYEPLLGD